MPNLGPLEITLLVFLILVLFGANKLPGAARSLGRSLRIFKSEVKQMSDDDVQQAQAQPQAPVQPQQLPPAAPQPGVAQPGMTQPGVAQPYSDPRYANREDNPDAQPPYPTPQA